MARSLSLIHCSYHKCLTVYYAKVMRALYNRIMPWTRGYRHFESNLSDFYENLNRYRILSVNNHKLELARLGDFRITRFVRDPRDLVVSGYFYHKRGAEAWCRVVGPREEDWEVVNGTVPSGVGQTHSFASYLQSIPVEEGLIAEIEFRKKHFQSMLEWPTEDERIATFRYEDIVGSEQGTFAQLFEFYQLPWIDKTLGCLLAGRYSASRQQGRVAHIRDPEPSQWKRVFTPRTTDYFNESYGPLLTRLGYGRD